MTMIDPSAVIDSSRGAVEYGKAVYIGANVTLVGPLRIGDGVTISPGVIVGCAGESLRDGSDWDTPIVIGAGARLREHVVVQRGLIGARGTIIEGGCYIMHGTHVAHDCKVEEGVTLSPYVVLGGHSTVQRGATLGIHSAIHQYVTVGAYSMLGMGAMAIDDIPPGMTAVGVPARVKSINKVGLERAGNPALSTEIERWESARKRKVMPWVAG